MDGLTATKLIRAQEKLMTAPYNPVSIFAITAGALEEEILDCLQAGMDAVLIKPITRVELIGKLSTVCPRVRRD